MSPLDLDNLPSNLIEMLPPVIEALMAQLIDLQLGVGHYFLRSEGPGFDWSGLHLALGTKVRARRRDGTFCFGFVMDGSILVNMKHYRTMDDAVSAMCGHVVDDPWAAVELKRAGDEEFRLPSYLARYQVPPERWDPALNRPIPIEGTMEGGGAHGSASPLMIRR